MSSRESSARRVGIDAARGLAVVLMIQTHAYDAWVREADRGSVAYLVTRQLGAIPAPLFLLLAGVGIALAEASAKDVRALRAKLGRRGLEVVAWGYGVSLVYELIQGSFRATSLLRVDILHAIGLSIVVCTLLVGSRSLLRWGALGAVALAAGPLFAWAGGAEIVPSPLAPVCALFVDVAPYTRFPLFPLVLFTAIGILAGRWLLHRNYSSGVWALSAVGLAALAAAFTFATRASVAALGGTLTRAHPAVVLNVADGALRALSVLAIGLAIEARSPKWLLVLGRGSLFAYAFHIPFCYSRLVRPIRHQLDMWEASGLVVLLVIVTLLAVLARDAVAARLRSARTPAPEKEREEREEPRR